MYAQFVNLLAHLSHVELDDGTRDKNHLQDFGEWAILCSLAYKLKSWETHPPT
jgi:hypothetical protein